MHCTGYSIITGAGEVPGCYSVIFEIADGSGHGYYGAGARQVDLGEQPVQTFDVWVDPGLGVKYTFTVSRSPAGITGPADDAGHARAAAAGSLRVLRGRRQPRAR